MTSAAQIAANRLNAQKSTGPRTPEGKEKVSWNALKHGLLAREGVLRGEDADEYLNHQGYLLRQLMPDSPLEEILANRIVALSWQLQRAARDRDEAFAALYEQQTAGTGEAPEPAGDEPILGRMLLADFGQDAVLERLLKGERRIESSLYRTIQELRRVHDQQVKAAQEEGETLARWREEDGECKKARMFACCPPAAEPGGPAPQTPPWLDYGADEMPGEKLCETNPIGIETKEGQVLAGTEFRDNGVPNPPEKTKPIGGGVSSFKFEVSSQESRGPSLSSSDFTLETPNLTLSASDESCVSRTVPSPAAGSASPMRGMGILPMQHRQDADATVGGSRRCYEEELRQTNPIPPRAMEWASGWQEMSYDE